MSKQFWGVIAAIIVVFVGIAIVSGNKSDSSSKGNTNLVTQHVQGQGTAGVTIVEYGDYQCPYCGQYHPTLKQVMAQYGDKIKFQFRNFPLTSVHQNAFAASRAAEAAALQDKYWEMHDVLYQTQASWSNSSDPSSIFAQYAKQLGINEAQFKKDYASSKVNDTINADLAEGTKLKITGTPSFFVNGKQTQISNDVASFSKVIDAAIAKQPATSSGTTQTTKQ